MAKVTLKEVDAIDLFEKRILRKGTRVKLAIKGFEEFSEIQDIVIRKARFGEIENDWVVIVLNGETYCATWITEIDGYEKN